MKQKLQEIIKKGIATSIATGGEWVKQYPWLSTPEDFNYESSTNIANQIFESTGLILSNYHLEGGGGQDYNWKHTFVLPFASAFPDTLNLSTLCESIYEAVYSEFEEVDIVLKGVGMNIHVIVTI